MNRLADKPGGGIQHPHGVLDLLLFSACKCIIMSASNIQSLLPYARMAPHREQLCHLLIERN